MSLDLGVEDADAAFANVLAALVPAGVGASSCLDLKQPWVWPDKEPELTTGTSTRPRKTRHAAQARPTADVPMAQWLMVAVRDRPGDTLAEIASRTGDEVAALIPVADALAARGWLHNTGRGYVAAAKARRRAPTGDAGPSAAAGGLAEATREQPLAESIAILQPGFGLTWKPKDEHFSIGLPAYRLVRSRFANWCERLRRDASLGLRGSEYAVAVQAALASTDVPMLADPDEVAKWRGSPRGYDEYLEELRELTRLGAIHPRCFLEIIHAQPELVPDHFIANTRKRPRTLHRPPHWAGLHAADNRGGSHLERLLTAFTPELCSAAFVYVYQLNIGNPLS